MWCGQTVRGQATCMFMILLSLLFVYVADYTRTWIRPWRWWSERWMFTALLLLSGNTRATATGCDRMKMAITLYTETEMSSFWQNFHQWLYLELSKWQLPVQSVMKISSKWHFRFSVTHWSRNKITTFCRHLNSLSGMEIIVFWSKSHRILSPTDNISYYWFRQEIDTYQFNCYHCFDILFLLWIKDIGMYFKV